MADTSPRPSPTGSLSPSQIMSTVTGELSTGLSSRSTSQLSSPNAPPLPPQTSVVANGGQVNPQASSDLSQTVAAGSNDSSNAAQISRTALIGIIAGSAGFVVLVVVLALIFILRRRRKRRRAQPPADSSSESEENQVAQKKPPTLRAPSQDQPPRRSTGDGHVYEAVGFGTNNTALLSAPTYYHDKDVSSEATTPNQRHSVTLENEDTKEVAPLDIDPFSSGYIPPPSPTPSEYVIVEHTAEPPLAPRTSRDKRESHVSLLDTVVHEEETNGFATLDSLTSQRTSTLGHRRTRSGEASGSGATTPPPKRSSNRLQKPRPSIESTSSLFLRSTSPTSPASLRNRTPIVFPRDPFEASVEEEPTSAVSGLRTSLERPARPSYEMKEIDGQSTNKPSVSARPSLDTIAAGAAPADRPSYSRKRSHIRSPSSPTRVIPNSPSFLGIGSVRRIGGSSSVLSLQNIHDYDNPSANAPYMNSATMADASVYDFDIYREPTTPNNQATTTSPSVQSHPPPASAARLSAALNAADVYGSGSSRKRFSASMSDLPIIPASPLPDAVRFPTSASTTNVNLHGKETTTTAAAPAEPKRHESTINLYIPKESLDLPP